jgi:hypothetical protein
MRTGLQNMRLGYILLKNSEGGAHRMESKTGHRHDEGANDAAPPRSEVLVPNPGGLVLRSSPLPPLLCWPRIGGSPYCRGGKTHIGARFFGATPHSEVLARFLAGFRVSCGLRWE